LNLFVTQFAPARVHVSCKLKMARETGMYKIPAVELTRTFVGGVDRNEHV